MYVYIIVLLLITLLILKFGMDIKIKDILKIKNMATDEKYSKLLEKFPNNKKICEDILKMIENRVDIEELKDGQSKTSLYLVMQNKIVIANIQKTFTRIQTVAHECIHSIQNKKLLQFNFYFSNFNNLFFLIICILSIFKIVNKEILNILLIILILIQFVFFIVRNFLETDAMIRAEYLSAEYIRKTKILDKKSENLIVDKYKELNKIGIKLYNYSLVCICMVKIIIYCLFLTVF